MSTTLGGDKQLNNSTTGQPHEVYSTDDESTGQKSSSACKAKEDSKLFVDINWEKIISKIKSDSMFELRKLAYQQRPVSEFGSKLTLEQHLANRPQPTSQPPPPPPATPTCGDGEEEARDAVPAQSEEQEASSLNVSARVQQLEPSGEENATERPEEIQQDMHALLELRVVNAILQGPVHEEIDQALREGMDRNRSRQRPRPRPRPSHADGGEEGGDEMNPAPVGRLLGRSRRQRGGHNRRVRFRPQIPTPNADGRYSIPRRDQGAIVECLRRSPALNSLGEEARDEIVAEVGGLVSQHLVTSALAGNFRGTLELLIQSRVDEIEGGGQAGPGRVLRQQQQPNQDSQYAEDEDRRGGGSASGADVRELREEMVIMKGQLNELKQMMRVSFDLQLDIQRAIRQEVAAALSAFLSPQTPLAAATGGATPLACPIPTLGAPGGSGSTSQPTGVGASGSSVKVVEAGHCVICSEGVIDSVMYHCGHMCTCTACGLELKSKALKCPICRAPISDVIRTYASML